MHDFSYWVCTKSRVSDPHWFNADPDPAFFLIADPDSGSGFPDSGSGSRIRIPDPDCNLLISRPPKRTPKLQEKPSALKGEHPVLKNMKTLQKRTLQAGTWLRSALKSTSPHTYPYMTKNNVKTVNKKTWCPSFSSGRQCDLNQEIPTTPTMTPSTSTPTPNRANSVGV